MATKTETNGHGKDFPAYVNAGQAGRLLGLKGPMGRTTLGKYGLVPAGSIGPALLFEREAVIRTAALREASKQNGHGQTEVIPDRLAWALRRITKLENRLAELEHDVAQLPKPVVVEG